MYLDGTTQMRTSLAPAAIVFFIEIYALPLSSPTQTPTPYLLFPPYTSFGSIKSISTSALLLACISNSFATEIILSNSTSLGLTYPGANLHSYLTSKKHNKIFISLLAKNRPGHACCPCPKSIFSVDSATN